MDELDVDDHGGLATTEVDLGMLVMHRYRNSTAPEHQQLRAVVGAMMEVLKEQGLPASPTAYFAATMSSLERQCDASAQDVVGTVTTAFCTFLATVLPKVPVPVLRSKGDNALALMVKILKEDNMEPATVKMGLTCMEHLLRTVDHTNWLTLAPSFNVLLKHSIDLRPKVRKRAQASMGAVFGSIQVPPTLERASEALVTFFEASIQAVMSTQGSKQKNKKSDPASSAVDILHMLSALRIALPVMSGKAVGKILPRLVLLIGLRQGLVTKQCLNAIEALGTSINADISPTILGTTLEQVSTLLSTERKDIGETMCAIHALRNGFIKLHNLDHTTCSIKLPVAFHAITGLLASEQEEVVFGASDCLKALVGNCIDDSMIQQGICQIQLHGDKRNSPPSCIERICVTAESMLGYQYRGAWRMALGVISALFDRLGDASQRLMTGVIKSLDELHNLEDNDMPLQKQLHTAVGAAVVAMGPEKFLELLPLQVDREDLSEARVWLLPILKHHIVGATLCYFVTHIKPLCDQLVERASRCTADGRPVASKNLEACHYSLWSLLPSFCNYPSDTTQSFRKIAKLIGDALAKNELRGILCSSLQILIKQNRLARGDDVEGADIGFSESSAFLAAKEHAKLAYTKEVASANLQAIASFSHKYLPLLSNIFVSSPPEKRGDVQAVLGQIAAITDKKRVKESFLRIGAQLLEATKGSASAMEVDTANSEAKSSVRRCVFMDLALSLMQGLDDESLRVLYVTAKPALQDSDGAVQKKAYKVLAWTVKEHKKFLTEKSDEILGLVKEATVSCQAPAKRYRLLLLHVLILHLMKVGNAKDNDAIQSMLVEVVLSLKETNKKTRNEAYDLLVGIGHGMLDATPGSSEKLMKLFVMVTGCIAGKSSQMQSAAITAISRLIYEFSSNLCQVIPDILPLVFELLKTKSREIVKSVLGFTKVIVARLSPEDLETHLKSLVDGLLLWINDSKNRFKAKVRIIIERLIRKCGMDAVSAVVPEEHAKLIKNIRKKRDALEKKKQASKAEVEDEAKSSVSQATTARHSKWDHTEFFSDNDDDSDEMQTNTKASTLLKNRSTTKSKNSAKSGHLLKSKKRLPGDMQEENEPLDLLDAKKTRAVLSVSKAKADTSYEDDDVCFDEDGRLIVNAENDTHKRRKRDIEEAKDTDSQQKISKKKVRANKGKHDVASKKAQKASSSWAYKGEEYANKKGGGGDNKQEGKMEPYAYWPLDAKMLNRREGKRAAARKGMASVIKMSKKLEGLSVNKAKASIQKKKHKPHKGKGKGKK